MKVRIKSGECPDYLTVGKIYYVVVGSHNTAHKIQKDTGDYIKVILSGCPHLNWGSWEIVDE